MLESGPNNPAIAARRLKHHSRIQQLIKYPLDTAFSEKALIIDIYAQAEATSRE
jgi:hypothetical protein